MSEIIVIEAGKGSREYWRDLWRYRELFYVLAWRDISVRYKQTAIGVLWALIQPLLTMLIFTVVFGILAKMPSNGMPYPLLVFAGVLPWQFFSNSLAGASQSLVGNSNLISKVYFPRLIIPASAIITASIDLLISLALMLILMCYYQITPTWRMLFLPGFIVLAFLAALGPGLLMTALNVSYRDFRYIIPFILQVGYFVSPVGYSTEIVPQKWRTLYSLNPIVAVIDGFRWSVLGIGSDFLLSGLATSIVSTMLFLYLGFWYFRKTEKTFADHI